MSDSHKLLRQAVKAARAGERERAVELLLDLVEQDPYSPRAWLELSKLVDDPRDQITALENTLALCPEDERIRARLEVLRESCPELRETTLTPEEEQELEGLYLQAVRLHHSGASGEAVELLRQVVGRKPQDERAWMLLSAAQPDPKDKASALEKAISINPLNEEAWRRLESLRNVVSDPFKRAQHLEERGDFEQAIQVYVSIVTHSRSAVERREAQLRIEQIRQRQEADEINPVNPTLNLLRLTTGPVLLFMIMVFIQSGLNLFHIPLLALPGALSVLAGSLLVSVTDMRPAHPRWVKLFGRPGTGDEPDMRAGLRLLGLALLLAPYTMFLIEAGYRLGVLQASMLGGLP